MRVTRRGAAAALLSAAVGLSGVVLGARGGLSGPAGGSAGTARRADAAIPVDLYLRRWLGVPPDAEIRVDPARPAPIQGLEALSVTLSLDGQTRQLELLRSADGRYLIAGRLLDLTADPHAAAERLIDLTDRPSLGRPDAPVTVVEYSDFQCPFCRRMSPVVHETMEGPLGQDVRWVYKHFPLTSLHPWAEPAAVAAECARRVGGGRAFWALHDHYFEQQERFTPENHRRQALAWARSAGLPVDAFEACLDSPEALERVRADVREGRSIGVSSTPTIVINGRPIAGALPAEALADILEQELAFRRALERLEASGR